MFKLGVIDETGAESLGEVMELMQLQQGSAIPIQFFHIY